jgi:hypothetical protein
VTDHRASDERLRAAFQSLGDTAQNPLAPEDMDRIWRAASGELPPEERRELVDRMATDPGLAESWRLAHELQRGASPAQVADVHQGRWWMQPWVAVAALVLLTVGIAVTMQRSRSGEGDTLRDTRRVQVESLIPADTPLPRNAFRLRWTRGPEGSRYDVRVTTEDLRLLATAMDLSDPELVVNADALAMLTPRSRVFWQVDAKSPAGETIPSPTFVVRVE